MKALVFQLLESTVLSSHRPSVLNVNLHPYTTGDRTPSPPPRPFVGTGMCPEGLGARREEDWFPVDDLDPSIVHAHRPAAATGEETAAAAAVSAKPHDNEGGEDNSGARDAAEKAAASDGERTGADGGAEGDKGEHAW